MKTPDMIFASGRHSAHAQPWREASRAAGGGHE